MLVPYHLHWSSYATGFGFCILSTLILIGSDRGRGKEERDGSNLRYCNLLDFQGIIQQCGGWKVFFNEVFDDDNMHIWIIQL